MSGCFDSVKTKWLCGFCMEKYESADNHNCDLVRSLKDKFNDALRAIQHSFDAKLGEVEGQLRFLQGYLSEKFAEDFGGKIAKPNFEGMTVLSIKELNRIVREELQQPITFNEEHKIQRAYKLSHLEKRLHQKNVQLREKIEAYDKLLKEYGERGRKLDAALNDLHCAIINDRQSNEALMEAKITINRLHDQLGKAEASCAERVGHLGQALHCLQEENNKLRLQLMNKCCKDYPHVGECHGYRKTQST
jgi:hypothetical protein